MNPYKLHSPSTLVGNEQDRPANPWRHDAKHVSPHLIWQINPPQRASQKRRRKPSVSVMTSALLFSRGWHLPFVGGTFHSPPFHSPTSELPTCPSFPRRREASHHTHSTGFPPARERLTGVAHGAGMAHAAIYNGHLCLGPTSPLSVPGTYLDLCLAPTLICAWHLPCLCVPLPPGMTICLFDCVGRKTSVEANAKIRRAGKNCGGRVVVSLGRIFAK